VARRGHSPHSVSKSNVKCKFIWRIVVKTANAQVGESSVYHVQLMFLFIIVFALMPPFLFFYVIIF